MSIIQKLTLAHLKKNKGRTVVTILGICVSVAMITAVFVCIASFFNYFEDVSYYGSGDWVACAAVNEENIEKLTEQDEISRLGLVASLSPKKSSFSIDGRSPRWSVGSIFAGDRTALSQFVTADLEGELPALEDEIIVSKEFIEKNELNWKIGDRISLSTGERSYNGEYITGKYIPGEAFTALDEAEYTISGIIGENLPTRNYTILRLADEDELKSSCTAYIQLKSIDFNSYAALTRIMKDCGCTDYSISDDVLATNFSFAADSSLVKSTLPMCALILAVIMFASVALIYNAFGMSLSERTRYLGMLASTGATRQQKSASVYFEGFILGLIGIPVGIGAGVLGIYITLQAVGSRIQESGMINGGENVELKVIVPLWVIIGVIIVSAVTIFISAMIPARKASRITPISAIRQTNEIRVNARRLRSSRLVRVVFGYEGELANKNMKRNGRKSRVITGSIALSIVLFLTCNTFCDMFVKANDIQTGAPYQIYASVETAEDYELLYNEAYELEQTEKLYSVTNISYVVGASALETNQDIVKDEYLTSAYKDLFDDNIAFLNIIDDDAFKKLCYNNGIDSAPYFEMNSDAPLKIKSLLMNNVSHEASGPKAFNDSIIGQSFCYNEFGENGKPTGEPDPNVPQAVVSDFVEYDPDNYVCGLNSDLSVSLYAPLSTYLKACKATGYPEQLTLGIETGDADSLEEQLNTIVDDNSLTGVYVLNMESTMQTMNTLIFVLQVFIYGFVALITLISVANIINTVSTGIDLRKKEFAMFKSVGITPAGFRKMICLESLFYGLKALLFGLPASVLLSYLMYLALQSSLIPFTVNVFLYLAVVAAVFLIVGFAMFFSVSKLKKDSIVETLKEDIV